MATRGGIVFEHGQKRMNWYGQSVLQNPSQPVILLRPDSWDLERRDCYQSYGTASFFFVFVLRSTKVELLIDLRNQKLNLSGKLSGRDSFALSDRFPFLGSHGRGSPVAYSQWKVDGTASISSTAGIHCVITLRRLIVGLQVQEKN